MELTDTVVVAEKGALRVPVGTAPDWYERIEKARAARKLGIQLQSSRKTESRNETQGKPSSQWHTADDSV